MPFFPSKHLLKPIIKFPKDHFPVLRSIRQEYLFHYIPTKAYEVLFGAAQEEESICFSSSRCNDVASWSPIESDWNTYTYIHTYIYILKSTFTDGAVVQGLVLDCFRMQSLLWTLWLVSVEEVNTTIASFRLLHRELIMGAPATEQRMELQRMTDLCIIRVLAEGHLQHETIRSWLSCTVVRWFAVGLDSKA